ncbi:MAG: hypothetical protein AB7R63_13695 [Phycisphaerales bacterium]
MKRIALVLFGVILGAGTMLGGPALSAGTVHGPGGNPPQWMTFACPEEDSAACYWDATTAGDGGGTGHSFYSIVFDRGTPKARNCIAFWDKEYGIPNNRCYPMP